MRMFGRGQSAVLCVPEEILANMDLSKASTPQVPTMEEVL
jgi:hypothetical protein